MSPPNFHPAPDPRTRSTMIHRHFHCFAQLLTGFFAGFLGNSVTFQSWNVGHIASVTEGTEGTELLQGHARAPQIIRQFRDIWEPGKCYRFCAVEVRSSCASHPVFAQPSSRVPMSSGNWPTACGVPKNLLPSPAFSGPLTAHRPWPPLPTARRPGVYRWISCSCGETGRKACKTQD